MKKRYIKRIFWAKKFITTLSPRTLCLEIRLWKKKVCGKKDKRGKHCRPERQVILVLWICSHSLLFSLSFKQNLNLLLGYLNQLCTFLMNIKIIKKWNIWSRFLKMHFSCHVHYIHIWLYRVFRWYVVNFYDPDQVNLIYFTPFGAVNFFINSMA